MQKIILFCWFLLCCSPFLQGQTVKYVKADATGLNNGQSWQDAFVNLKHALAAANYGDTLWVAQGVYFPHSVNNSRDSSFILKSGVSIFGGFSGDETALSQRNLTQYPTILSGDIGVPGDSTDNVYNVLLGRDVDTTTVLDGLVVEYGYADSSSPTMLNLGAGGGLYLQTLNSAATISPIFRYCIFRKNYAKSGASAVSVHESGNSSLGIRFENCQFLENYGLGGCIRVVNMTSSLYMADCRIANNVNGSVSVSYSQLGKKVHLLRDTFDGNVFSQQEIGIVNLNFMSIIDVVIEKCFFSNGNIAKFSNFGSLASSVVIKNCSFINHTFVNMEGDVSRFVFIDNEVKNNLSVRVFMPSSDADFSFKRNKFVNNNNLEFRIKGDINYTDNFFSGGNTLCYLYANTANRNGYFNNCVFNKNKLRIEAPFNGTSPGKIGTHFNFCSFFENQPLVVTIPMFNINQGDSLTFNSCIFAIPPGNVPFIASRISPDQHISVANSVFSVSDCMDISAELGAEICANNQTGAMIQFVDTLNGDFHLLPCSSGINAGDMSLVNALGLTIDLSGTPRVANGLPDAGALETVVEEPVVSTQTVSCAEKNDGAIGYTSLDCNVWNYTWTSSNGATGTLLDNLAAGEYYITLSNGINGLLWTDTVQLAAPPVSWTTDFALTPASSVIATDGAIAALVTGSGTFTYLWSNGATTAQINQLAAGTYTVTITNGDGCSAVYSQILGISATGETPLPVVHLSPNPVRAGEYLQLPEIAWTSLELHDATGRRVWNVQNGGHQVVLPASLSEGLYYMLLSGKNGGIGYAKVVVVQ